MCHSRILSPSKASEHPILFPHHLRRAEMFAVRRSDENELERKFLPAHFASRVQHRLVPTTTFESCGTRTTNGRINLYIKLEKHKLNQIAERNITISLDKGIAISKYSYSVSEGKRARALISVRYSRTVKSAPINVMSEGGPRDRVGTYDQTRKFGGKLPNPWDEISIQSPPLGEGFEFNISHETENFRPSNNEVKNMCLHLTRLSMIVLLQ